MEAEAAGEHAHTDQRVGHCMHRRAQGRPAPEPQAEAAPRTQTPPETRQPQRPRASTSRTTPRPGGDRAGRAERSGQRAGRRREYSQRVTSVQGPSAPVCPRVPPAARRPPAAPQLGQRTKRHLPSAARGSTSHKGECRRRWRGAQRHHPDSRFHVVGARWRGAAANRQLAKPHEGITPSCARMVRSPGMSLTP